MAHKAFTLIIVVSTMLLCTTTISAFNITRLLDQHSEFKTFNDLLTRTGVAGNINNHKTITVLVVDNSGIGAISGKPDSTIKSILETHVLLDYYDTVKLQDVDSKGVISVNLYQTSGVANKQQGQTNLTNSGGQVVFGSAMKGASRDSKMVKQVAAQPYNISVIQLSQPIATPGLIDQTAPPPGSPTASPPTPVAAPPPKAAEAPAPEADADAPAADADAPAADEDAGAPDSEGPAAASGPSPSPAPEGDEADKEPPAKQAPPPKNGAVKSSVGGVFAVTALMGLLALSF